MYEVNWAGQEKSFKHFDEARRFAEEKNKFDATDIWYRDSTGQLHLVMVSVFNWNKNRYTLEQWEG